MKDDCYIPGYRNEDPADMARKAVVTATSCRAGCEPEKVINGIARNEEDTVNLWQSEGIGAEGETLCLKLEEVKPIREIRLTFDPNLSEERCISVSKAFLDKEPTGPAKELVRDYTVTVYSGGRESWRRDVSGNYQRLNVLSLPEGIQGDEVRICITATNGDEDARVFEVRIY